MAKQYNADGALLAKRRAALKKVAHRQALADAALLTGIERDIADDEVARLNERAEVYLNVRISPAESAILREVESYLDTRGVQSRHTHRTPKTADAVRYIITLAGQLLETIKEKQK